MIFFAKDETIVCSIGKKNKIFHAGYIYAELGQQQRPHFYRKILIR